MDTRVHGPFDQIPFKYHWTVLGGIIANGIWMVSEWYFDYILDSLYRSMVLNGILNYHWEYHWVLLKYHWIVQYWMVLSGIEWYTISSFLMGYITHAHETMVVCAKKLNAFEWSFKNNGKQQTEKPHVLRWSIAIHLVYHSAKFDFCLFNIA